MSAKTRVAALIVAVELVFCVRLLRNISHKSFILQVSDFHGMWSYGLTVLQHRIDTIYDPAVMLAFQSNLAPTMQGFLPCFYPPPALLLFAPLGLLREGAAALVWATLGLTLFTLSTWDPRRRKLCWMALLLPTTVLSATFGQTGLLASAALLSGLRLVPSRPVLGGMLLGLLAMKPQFGMLLPVALLAAGQGRAFVAAALSGASVVALSLLTFGVAPWIAWVHALPIAERQWHTDAHTLLTWSPTPTASLAALDTPWPLIHVVQVIVAAIAALAVWVACRSGLDRRAIAVVCTTFFLATPHGFAYDMPATAAALLLLGAERLPTPRQFFPMLFVELMPVWQVACKVPLAGPLVMAVLLCSLMAPELGGAWRAVRRRSPLFAGVSGLRA
ncbi:MAG: DUF2029 domain-containing protein [Gluconacetobacter diazotrophicus]|nr:DUF2029 domain-containing protein [Gluconacetobacter diazotrophicus]